MTPYAGCADPKTRHNLEVCREGLMRGLESQKQTRRCYGLDKCTLKVYVSPAWCYSAMEPSGRSFATRGRSSRALCDFGLLFMVRFQPRGDTCSCHYCVSLKVTETISQAQKLLKQWSKVSLLPSCASSLTYWYHDGVLAKPGCRGSGETLLSEAGLSRAQSIARPGF